MFDRIFSDGDGWMVLKVAAILLPVLVFVWVVCTVMALHRRDVYFWSLGSTCTSLIACPVAVAIMCFSTLSRMHDENAPLFEAPILAGAMLYAAALAYALFYNFRATKSAVLALSTSMLQQLAVLGLIFVFLSWRGDEVNRGRR